MVDRDFCVNYIPRTVGYEVIDAAFKRYKDGREVCLKTTRGLAEYRRRRDYMYKRDNGLCCICNLTIGSKKHATFEHKNGRGMGGAKRDDRTHLNGVAHLQCNLEKGSKRASSS